MSVVVGVLALQGGFSTHIALLKKVGVTAKEVRKPKDLEGCTALIIPGGESTAILKQVRFIEMHDALNLFAAQKPVMGTCAGLILMSRHIVNDTMVPFGWLDVDIKRNAFGRQADSFHTLLEVKLGGSKLQKIPALFIRAPTIERVGQDVEILAQYQNQPVFVRQGKLLGLTFHPELTQDASLHQFFIDIVKNRGLS